MVATSFFLPELANFEDKDEADNDEEEEGKEEDRLTTPPSNIAARSFTVDEPEIP